MEDWHRLDWILELEQVLPEVGSLSLLGGVCVFAHTCVHVYVCASVHSSSESLQ